LRNSKRFSTFAPAFGRRAARGEEGEKKLIKKLGIPLARERKSAYLCSPVRRSGV